jgi:hypothetical protein
LGFSCLFPELARPPLGSDLLVSEPGRERPRRTAPHGGPSGLSCRWPAPLQPPKIAGPPRRALLYDAPLSFYMYGTYDALQVCLSPHISLLVPRKECTLLCFIPRSFVMGAAQSSRVELVVINHRCDRARPTAWPTPRPRIPLRCDGLLQKSSRCPFQSLLMKDTRDALGSPARQSTSPTVFKPQA